MTSDTRASTGIEGFDGVLDGGLVPEPLRNLRGILTGTPELLPDDE